MSVQRLQARRVVGDNLGLVLVGCLLLLALGGYLTYTTHVAPGVETERVQESGWSSATELTHSATVTTGTTVFPEGTVLQDRAAYLVSIAPAIDGSLEYSYQATGGGSLDVEVEQTAVLRSVEDEDGSGFEHWRIEESLASGRETGVSPGETVEVPYSLNISEQMAAADSVEAELGGTPGETELLVVSELSVSGDRNGVPVTESYTYETTVEVEGNVYRFDGEGPHEESGEQFTEREVAASHGIVRSVAGPLLAGLGGLGLVALGLGRVRGALDVSQTEREWLAYRTTYNEFEEWISTGHVPDDTLSGSRVTIDSLDALVNVAIDSNRRVVRDKRRSSYLVIVDETVYTYDPPSPPSSGLSTPGEPTEFSADSESAEEETAAESGEQSTTEQDTQ